MIIAEKRELEMNRRRGMIAGRDYYEELFRLMHNDDVVTVKNKHSACLAGRWEYIA